MPSSLGVSACMLACHCFAALVLCHTALCPHIARHVCCIHANGALYHFRQQHSIAHTFLAVKQQTVDTVYNATCHALHLGPNAKAQSLFAAVSQERCVCSMLSSQIALTTWQRHAGPTRNWKSSQDFPLALVQTCKITILTPALMAAIRLSLVM